MIPYYQEDGITLYCGDCLDILPQFPDKSFDSLVTDPPAGISFMGKDWDGDKGGRDKWIEWLSSVMGECLRVLKPGGHGLIWALPRTSHWTGIALEDAGFEVRDCIYHVFGSGFPKSLDISKQIDKQAGVERTIISKYQRPDGTDRNYENWSGKDEEHLFDTASKVVTVPSTPDAKQWSGWGTALKPAVECWWLVRKPPEGTVAENVLRWGVGGLNIDECRVEINEDDPNKRRDTGGYNSGKSSAIVPNAPYNKTRTATLIQGRFPSHLIHDGSNEVLELFPNSKTNRIEKPSDCFVGGNTSFDAMRGKRPARGYDGNGSAARFFYCPKPSKRERDFGLEGMEEKESVRQFMTGTDPEFICSDGSKRHQKDILARNNHPTVKAIALMEYLIKLITPKGGVVHDPFMGSGSTGVACKNLGYEFIGIELNPEYFEIAQKRIAVDRLRRRELFK